MNQITLTVDINTDGIKSAIRTLESVGKQLGVMSNKPAVSSTSDQKVNVDVSLLTEGFDLPASESDATRDIEDDGERISDIAERAVNPGGVDLDAEGLPHDPRIHGANRLKLKKEGTWKKIKNISTNKPGLVEQVEAELRAALAATPAVETQPAETAAAAPPPPAETVDVAPPPPAETAAAAPPPPAEPEVVKYLSGGKEWTEKQLLAAKWLPAQIAALDVVETKTSNEPMTIADLMEKVPTALVKGTITQEDVDAALAKEGLANMPALYARPDLIPAIDTALFG